MNNENDVILAALRLSRAMRRCPPPALPCSRGEAGGRMPCPPAIIRLLSCVAENPEVSSRDLCEIMDLRPSSLSGMISQAEADGWIERTADTNDRRIQRVKITEKGTDFPREIEETREKDSELKSACFSEEEKIQFCALSNRLTQHLESLDLPQRPAGPGGPGWHRGPGWHGAPGGPMWHGAPAGPGGPGGPEIPEWPEEPEGPGGPEGPGAKPPRKPLPKGRIRC